MSKGIVIENCDNVTLADNRIEGFDVGIEVKATRNLVAEGNVVKNNTLAGNAGAFTGAFVASATKVLGG